MTFLVIPRCFNPPERQMVTNIPGAQVHQHYLLLYQPLLSKGKGAGLPIGIRKRCIGFQTAENVDLHWEITITKTSRHLPKTSSKHKAIYLQHSWFPGQTWKHPAEIAAYHPVPLTGTGSESSSAWNPSGTWKANAVAPSHPWVRLEMRYSILTLCSQWKGIWGLHSDQVLE